MARLTTTADVVSALRQLADAVENGSKDLLVEVKAKNYPRITAARIEEQERALRMGYVLDLTTPTELSIKYDNRSTDGIGWPD